MSTAALAMLWKEYIYIMILYIISYIYIIESLNSIAKAAVDSFEDVSEHSEGTYFNDCLA